MTEQISKTELMDRIAAGYEALEQTVAGLDGLQLEHPGPEGWAIKDHLFHLAAWERGIAWLLTRRSRFQGMEITPEEWYNLTMDQVNDLVYQRNRERPATEALAALREAHQTMLDALAPLSDADLQRPYAEYGEGGGRSADRPIIGWIIGDTYEHYEEHLGYLRAILAA
ncbi:MAG: ClbS/DfsB family four-helix bundle protein [Candidatus Promineofilum sp.]|jgi:hypothetical protein|nr:ClbS/DfsB family four-helix bundle protein [Promineifilum sp.]